MNLKKCQLFKAIFCWTCLSKRVYFISTIEPISVYQWVETNQSNFRIYLTDIRLSLPRGTMLMAYVDVRKDVDRC